MADKNPIITVDLNMFSQDAEAKTTEANKVAKSLGISDEALAKVEDFKQALTEHNAWDLPFMGYVNEDGYGYAYVPDAAITMNPYWDAHKEFMNLPEDVQTAFAIRMLFTHRPVDRYGADMFLHYHRGFQVNFIAPAPTSTDRDRPNSSRAQNHSETDNPNDKVVCTYIEPMRKPPSSTHFAPLQLTDRPHRHPHQNRRHPDHLNQDQIPVHPVLRGTHERTCHSPSGTHPQPPAAPDAPRNR